MGRAGAIKLAETGRRVFIADLDLEAAEDTARLVTHRGGEAFAFAVDVSKSESVRKLFDGLRRETDSLDMLVHAAGVLGETAPIEEMSDEQWRLVRSVNLDGTFYCCREAVRWMNARSSGRIVLFSSIASVSPTPGALHYSASKGGVNMLAKTLAKEAAKHNIRVNVVAPGYVRTPLLEGLPEGFEEHIVKRTPLGRLGEAEEIAAFVEFLASPSADFLTGQVISPNGGLVI